MVNQTPGDFGLPGLSTLQTGKSRQFLFGLGGLVKRAGFVVHADTVDAGGTPTTELRPGMVLVRIETGAHKGKFCQYGHAEAPASAAAIKDAVILDHYLEMRDSTGTAVDKQGGGLIGGVVDESKIVFVSVASDVILAMKAALNLVRFVPAVA